MYPVHYVKKITKIRAVYVVSSQPCQERHPFFHRTIEVDMCLHCRGRALPDHCDQFLLRRDPSKPLQRGDLSYPTRSLPEKQKSGGPTFKFQAS
jgi:hypothetical protein